ncbi:MAG: hypothetical protein ACTSRP_13640 [Candidatus Helarchaeota archaeon]
MWGDGRQDDQGYREAKRHEKDAPLLELFDTFEGSAPLCRVRASGNRKVQDTDYHQVFRTVA